MPSGRRVLITGAAGVIGEKLRRHLLGIGRYELRLVDLNSNGDPDVTFADLRVHDPAWTSLFEGVDAVVHLASAQVSTTWWDDAIAGNIDMLLNVYNAAAEHRVRRVVFASSVWTMYGYRFRAGERSPSRAADPGVSSYGMMKIFGERTGRAFFGSHRISTVALRIGACPRDNAPGSHMPTGAWAQDCWLSDRDLCQGVERAILAEDISFAALNLTSRNTSMRWSLRETESALGYHAEDSHTTSVSLKRRLQALLARVFFNWVPAFSKRFVKPYW